MSDETVTPRKRAWFHMKREAEEAEKHIGDDNVVELVAPRVEPTIIELATEYSAAHDALKDLEYTYQAALVRFRKAEESFDAMWRTKESDAEAHDTFVLAMAHEVELAKAERLARRKSIADDGSAIRHQNGI
jgi:hypothetical protein